MPFSCSASLRNHAHHHHSAEGCTSAPKRDTAYTRRMAKVKGPTVASAGEGTGQRRLDYLAGSGPDDIRTWRNTSAVPPITDRHPCHVRTLAVYAHRVRVCTFTKTHTRVHSCCTNNDEKFKITQTPVFCETDKLWDCDAMEFYTAVK